MVKMREMEGEAALPPRGPLWKLSAKGLLDIQGLLRREFTVGGARMRYTVSLLLCICLLLLYKLAEGREALNLDCEHDVIITSPNYPGLYPVSITVQWDISAPVGRRILGTFNEFILDIEQMKDYLSIWDTTDKRIYKVYKGENHDPTPFLSMAHTMQIIFISVPTTRSTGFNLTLSCFRQGSELTRIVNGLSPEEGILEIRSSSDDSDWKMVCSDGFQRNTAEVVCRELGYPGVQSISKRSRPCGEEERCIQACSEYAFRITDCSAGFNSSSECASKPFVKIKCYKPGYKGCGNIKDILQHVFHIDSVTDCVSTCKTETNEELALTDGQQCVCATVYVQDLYLDERQCVGTPDTGASENAWMSVYNTSEGFCPKLDMVENGYWDSNMTWFGSTVHLQCYEGYTVSGAESLQCVPGNSTYLPVWNESDPSCVKIPTTEPTTQSTSVDKTDKTTILETDKKKKIMHAGLIVLIAIAITCIFGIILVASVVLIVRCIWLRKTREQNEGATQLSLTSQVS